MLQPPVFAMVPGPRGPDMPATPILEGGGIDPNEVEIVSIPPADRGAAPGLAAPLARSERRGVPAPTIAAALPGGGGGEVDHSTFAARGTVAARARGAQWIIRRIGCRHGLPDDAEAAAVPCYEPQFAAATR